MLKKIAAVAALVFALAGCSTQTPVSSGTSGAPQGGQTTEPGAAVCSYQPTGNAAKEVSPPDPNEAAREGQTEVTLNLNDQPIVLTLDSDAAPCTVNSFISLASQGYYNDTKCHRLADSSTLYVLQCGDPTGTGGGTPGYKFADELDGITGYPAGTLAMANAGPNTNGSQFFIVYEDSVLQPAFTVFGHLDAAGLEVVRNIAVGGSDGAYPDGTGAPLIDAVINNITLG
ncbi:MAG: peptidylprolyl isomerase [Propionibacteriaceae bacterium]|jgi:peptidyl-prolyl cis-trans isomerase B (cyclophilin B)|nr:peptidylprolyl isomerase [Propionibacteriaceae bacterium]